MDDDATQHSWFGPPDIAAVLESTEESREYVRQWQGFMTARLALSVVMVALQGSLYFTGFAQSRLLVAICVAYFVATLASRLLEKPHALGTSFNKSWLSLVGVDVVAFSALQIVQGNNINYTPCLRYPSFFLPYWGRYASPWVRRRESPCCFWSIQHGRI